MAQIDYADQQRNPAKHLVGLSVVVLLHVALVYVIMTGLARRVVEVIKKPLETQIIEEIKPPPPPPPVQLPPPPKFIAPPPPYIPPPEVQVNVPPPPNVITTQSVAAAPSPIAVVAPPAPVATPPAPPAPQNARAACPNYSKAFGDSAYPRDAIKEGLDRGEAVIRFTVSGDGELKDITTISQSNRAFGRAAMAVVREFKCIAQGRDVVFEIPFSFKRE